MEKQDTGKILLEIVTPEASFFEKPVVMATIPATNGEMGVMLDHAPTISSLIEGVVDVYENGRLKKDISERIFISGGFVKIVQGRCTLLADEAVPVGDINEKDLKKRISELEKGIKDAETDAEKKFLRHRLRVGCAKLVASQG
ncbi:MAG: ATP synthase F1 subunit epsilon [Alphaproteobacteria bacterium]